MKSALSTKVLDQNMIVLDSLKVEEFKTKTIVAMLKALNVEGKALLLPLRLTRRSLRVQQISQA